MTYVSIYVLVFKQKYIKGIHFLRFLTFQTKNIFIVNVKKVVSFFKRLLKSIMSNNPSPSAINSGPG